jgi:hypothetical protein
MPNLTMTELMSSVRKRHFKELIEYALERISHGGHRASQRQLAEQLMLAPGMIRRYLDMETSVEGLKFMTLYQISRACRLDVGSVFLWIEEGREKAMDHEMALGGQVPPFSALDLARRLVVILEGDGGGGGGGGGDTSGPKPDLGPLRQRVQDFAAEAGDLMCRMVRMVGAEAALAKLEDPALAIGSLETDDWQAVAALLEVEVRTLQLECGLSVAFA